jgi:tetratricopeptide (TPR) repeat protein
MDGIRAGVSARMAGRFQFGGRGTDAMALGYTKGRLSQLWQMPLLLVSVGLFGYAAYLFIDPKSGPTIDQKIEWAQAYLKQDRPEAAIEYLNQLLQTEKLDREHEARIHLMLAQALDQGQKQKKIDIPANHERIIEQVRLALALGAKPDAAMYLRLGEAFEALGRTAEALANYRQAMALDPNQSLRLQKRVIELQVDQGEPAAAEALLDNYLKSKDLTNAERAWALGQRAQLLIDRGSVSDARTLLMEALKLQLDPVAQGELNYRLGYCALKLGDASEAERYLRVARDQLRVQHPVDADACYLLGKIYQDRKLPEQANSFYQVVLVNHPDAKVAPLARLGRGVCRIMLNEDDAGLTDLHDLVGEVGRKSSRAKYKPEALESLRQAGAMLTDKGNFSGALEVLAYEQELQPDPPASFFARLGRVYERRADQLEASLADAKPADMARRGQQVRDMRSRAGDAYIAYSRALTLTDDKGYGEAMWKGIDLYDRASDLQRAISALEVFVAERPEDPLTPEALLRLGRALQAGGQVDKAIAAFVRIAFRYPNSLAASKSAVPLAQAYLAKGPEQYSKAESVLLSVLENNPLLTPDATEFRRALFELGRLYYRTGRYEEAVSRLEEWIQRYPKEEKVGQLLFLMADSYRKSAGLLESRVASDKEPPATMPADKGEALAARRDRLDKARKLYDRVIETYRVGGTATDEDRLYLKLSFFYRADCTYDLGNYEEAIRLYDAAAFRYQEDPSALAAYVQIVNSYCALGKIAEARTANERAKWLLRRMPARAFEDGSFVMPKAYWEQWLAWTSQSGMW